MVEYVSMSVRQYIAYVFTFPRSYILNFLYNLVTPYLMVLLVLQSLLPLKCPPLVTVILSGILLRSPREALRAALGHPSDGCRSRAGGTCPQYIVSTIPEASPPQGFVSLTNLSCSTFTPYSLLPTSPLTNTNNTRSVTLAFFSLASSLKVQFILKSIIRGILLPELIQ